MESRGRHKGLMEGEENWCVKWKVRWRRRRWKSTEETGDEAIRCPCACMVDKGEIGCCDVCEGWSHLMCIGMKEGVGAKEGKEFVCLFFVSACLLALQKEVRRWLGEEHSAVKGELKRQESRMVY